MAIISLEHMQFKAFIGCYSAEQELGNEIEISVTLYTSYSVLKLTDDIEKTINYETIYALVSTVIAERMNLLETAVRRILKKISGQYQQVNRAIVRVSKLYPPLGGRVERVTVEDEWVRVS